MMSLIETVKQAYRENYRLITTDKMLQKFMIGVFLLLTCIIVYCKFFGDFQNAEYYYDLAGKMLEGNFSYDSLHTDLPPVVLLLLVPPRIFSLNSAMYAVLFSIYGFAFYMLGGHFMLKSCRETGFPEKDAYVLLFLFFICSLSFMTLSTGPIASAFVIISLWFFHKRQYLLSFPILAIATMAGFYPVLLFLTFLGLLGIRRELKPACAGIVFYIVICAIFLLFPTWSGTPPYFDLPEYATNTCYFGTLYDWFGIDIHSANMVDYSLILSVTFIVCACLRVKNRSHGMYEAALIFEIALVLLLLMSPIYSEKFPIWIMMLFPMTQMTCNHYSGQKITYLVLGLFCMMTLVCDTVIGCEGGIHEILALIRTITLVAFLIQLSREFQSIA